VVRLAPLSFFCHTNSYIHLQKNYNSPKCLNQDYQTIIKARIQNLYQVSVILIYQTVIKAHIQNLYQVSVIPIYQTVIKARIQILYQVCGYTYLEDVQDYSVHSDNSDNSENSGQISISSIKEVTQ
jgi:uncharacterized protein (UPF0248 family)